jgi:hypothetical protein
MVDDADEPNYEVGHGRPPKHTRFKKGRSGNPGGRPKSRGSGPVDLAGILDQPIKVRRGEKIHEMSPFEASFRGHTGEPGRTIAPPIAWSASTARWSPARISTSTDRRKVPGAGSGSGVVQSTEASFRRSVTLWRR